MSKGKKWKMPKRFLHKRPFKYKFKYRVGGGKNGRYKFGYFRHKKKYQYLMEGKLSMGKLTALEIWYWD